MSEEKKKIGVGFGVMILRDGKVLLGYRNIDPVKADSALHGEGTWTMPGGKLHFGETFEDGAEREVFEETGIKINKEYLEVTKVTNDIVMDAHFVTLGFLCQQFTGEPEVKEPDEITEWKWFDLTSLPNPIYPPSQKLLDAYVKKSKGFGPFSELNKDNYQKYESAEFKNVFFSIPSSLFYYRADISTFALEQNICPLNPYMNFDYNIFNSVPKETVKIASNNLVKKSDEVWVFADNFHGLSDGVLSEIKLAKESEKPVKFFKLPEFKEIKDITVDTFGIDNYYGIKLKDVNWKTCYTAMTSKLFYYKSFISKFVLEKGLVPLNPFMSFDYFLVDRVQRNNVLFANSNLVKLGDELWVFGPISDGVLAEIKMAKEISKPIKYFAIFDKKEIKEITKDKAEFEDGLEKFRNEL